MASIVEALDSPSSYRDSRSRESWNHQQQLLAQSSTLYVGNLSFYTTEEQIYELFMRCHSAGHGIKRIIMGLDRHQKTPCGFAFVEYYTHEEAVDCLRYVSGTKLDERIIRCDLDPGYKEGRQYGRGKSGGQVRDEYRQEYDAGRGGWGHMRMREEVERQERERLAQQAAVYAEAPGEGPRVIPEGAGGEYREEEGRADGGGGVVAEESGVPAAAGAKRQRSEEAEGDEDGKRENPNFRAEGDNEDGS